MPPLLRALTEFRFILRPEFEHRLDALRHRHDDGEAEAECEEGGKKWITRRKMKAGTSGGAQMSVAPVESVSV